MNVPEETARIGVVGLRVVGTGVARLLVEDAEWLASRVGRRLE